MQLAIAEIRYIPVRKSAKDRLLKASRESLCVACMQPIGEGIVKRGCHERCYRATIRAIERGLTTEAERMSAGKLLEAQHGGRKPSNPVTVDVTE